MKKSLKFLALILALAMVCAMFAGCTKKPVDEPVDNEPEVNEEVENETTPEPEVDVPLVVAYSPFNEKFSPFYADTAYDQDVADMTQLGMMTTDRLGGIVFNAIEGEVVPYNGTDYTYTGPCDIKVAYDEATDTTTYTVKLKEGIKFSDGEDVTVDDILFTYYVYADPAYVGSTTLSSYNIIGLQDYQTQTTAAVYEKYNTMFNSIYAAGADHTWSEADGWTEEQQTAVWDTLKAVWVEDVQAIVDYVRNNYADYFPGYFGEEATLDDTTAVAFGMMMWGFGDFEYADEEGTKATDENGNFIFKGAVTGTTWDLATTFPTVEDYYNECYAAYAGDPVAYWGVEAADSTDVLGTATTRFISELGSQDEEVGGPITSISGITKVAEDTIEVKTQGYEAPAVYTICGLPITPMHYYGDESKWDPENGLYGHELGDLSSVEAKTTVPMGAGPYKYVKFENKVVYFEANENYYKGEPKIHEIQFKETVATEVASAIQTGTVDAGEMTGSLERFAEVQGYNSNGEITGDVITTSKVDNLGYGYIGINASKMNVAGEPDSDASKNLRRAFATMFSVYRDTSVDSYYGEAASVINYPISNTSWAAPQATDEGYAVAFSVDVDGNAIYTADMTADEKYAAAIAAATGFLKAAGYTFDEATGKFTAAPEGASLEYEVLIPGDGTGDHPSFAVLTDASNALATIGITLKVNDLADSSVLWDTMDANEHYMWCAAWSSTIDPDMYQVYHSSNVVGEGGSDSNHYHIQSDVLDQLILDARKSDDQAYRKSVYKQALDTIIDWAVEVPVYQRQNCIVFSTERINIDTLTPDITTFWGWMSEIEKLEMN